MTRMVPVLALAVLAALPLRAQEAGSSPEEGLSLIEQGARMLMRSMLAEVEPKLKDLHEEFGQAFAEMEPALRQLATMLGDLRNYHAPEILPNGDILIRRKQPGEATPPAPGAEIEL
ncbi:MAG: AAA+ family ATPase [Defluviimonas sp.]|uniref:AAA+ family ATPase n=1 Tax=Albidovulum sp. TaxID=1872424 RepID=UPI001D1FDEB2|nr:AAA+ family ATPase [Paracoccaceae bacterium]MCC0063683.1 AAA+ family ATPase [Defluviimonas sp.]